MDGWRGISILAVMAGHLLPLGPKVLQMNAAVATFGMAVFFTLSGFLITRFLLRNDDIPVFLVRRICRIVPLAWLYMVVTLTLLTWQPHALLAQLFFYANWPPMHLTDLTGHLWSLCVEMQFYIGIAALVLIGGKRAIFVLPLICVAVTGYRVWHGVHIAINTYYRVDEILAGCILALLYHKDKGAFLGKLPVFIGVPLLLAASHPEGAWLNYFRPYFAASMVGATIYQPGRLTTKGLESRPLRYVAEISYALYVLHGILGLTWLGSGDKVVKYLKRPLYFTATFALAHLSTFYYEHRWIALGKAYRGREGRRAGEAS